MTGATATWDRASLWARALPVDPPPSPRLPARRVDVVVIGAGVTGLVTAVVLERAGLDVLVLERHATVGGVTTRGSTGKLTALQGQRLAKVAEHRGQEHATAYAEASVFGVTGLIALVRELGLDCALADAADHTFATEPEAATVAAAVLDTARAAGLPVAWVDTTELPVPLLGAVRLEGQAHLDPGALCAELARNLGERVVTGAPVRSMADAPDGVEVQLDDGRTVRADHAVVATLGPIHDPALLVDRCTALRSYAVAAPITDPLIDTHLSVDAVSRSVRPAAIDGRPAVVVAGEGHVVGEGDRTPADRWAALEAYARDLGAGAATHRWVAHDLDPSDHVPFVGRNPRTDRVLVATGFGKWGISTAMVAADLFLGELEGRPRPWASTFDPGRLASSATTDLVKGGLRAARHLVVEPIADALHREPRAPRCTHQGCALAFDGDTRTWDCPCHGSRYDDRGRVVSGPATADLDPAVVDEAQARTTT